MMVPDGFCSDNLSLLNTARFGIFVVKKRDGDCPIADQVNVAISSHASFKSLSSSVENRINDLDQLSIISCSMFEDVDEFGEAVCKSYEDCNLKFSPGVCLSFSKKLKDHGCCILKDVFNSSSLQVAQHTCSKLIAKLVKRYDRLADEFNG